MTRPSHDTLLAFLEGRLGPEEREALLDRLDADPELSRELRLVATGLEALRTVEAIGEATASAPTAASPGAAGRTGGVPSWWIAAAVAATLLVSVPLTWWSASNPAAGPAAVPVVGGWPDSPAPSFVLVLQSLWPDAATVDLTERRRRAAEYWAWTTSLAESGVLVAAGDLRWEPGQRVAAGGVPLDVADSVVEGPDFMVGMFALRVSSYDEALAIARECPHLRYGGTVAVRQVGSGFVTVSGMSDWSD